jgi:hypothetical protein
MRRSTLRSGGLILGVLCLGGCVDGGPSEGDIAKAMKVGEPINAFAHPQIFSIVIKNAGAGAQFLALTQIKISSVKKNECSKASGKPGYVCAFGVLYSALKMDSKTWAEERPTNCEGRFVKGSEGWTAAIDL